MQQPSRRTLLAGTGTAIALGTAGVLGGVVSSEATPDGDADALSSGLEAALEYVYPSDDGLVLRIAQVPDDDEDRSGTFARHQFSDLGTPEWVVADTAISMDEQRRYVAVGSFEVDADTDGYSEKGSRGDFTLYDREDEDEDLILATDGETLLLGGEEWLTATLDSHDADESTYLEATEGVRSLLATVDFSGQTTLLDDDAAIRKPFEDAGVETTTLPDRLLAHFARTDDAIEYTLAGWYADLPEEPASPLAAFLSEQLSLDDVTTEVDADDGVAVAKASRPYTPPEERPETVGAPEFHEYDAENGTVRFRFDRGEQLPVERYELEIEGEVYEGDWARGQDEIGEGSIVAIDADAIEPGDELRISYEAPDEGYSDTTGTQVLRYLPFTIDFDPDARTATLEYVDGPPLSADRVTATLYGEDDERQFDPWSGAVTSGDTATLADLPIEGHVTVEYRRSDGETIEIGGVSFEPPGRFAFEYDGQAKTMTIRRPDLADEREEAEHPARSRRFEQEPLDASQYEVTVDGSAADRQWADVDDRIEPGASLTLQDVPVGTTVAVEWVGEDGDRYVVDQEQVVPEISFEFDYDGDAGEVTVTHDGGQSVAGDELAVRLDGEEERTVAWSDDGGSVDEGDEVVVADVPEEGFVVVTYGEKAIDYASIRELRDGE